MPVIAIETSGRDGSVALSRGGQVLEERVLSRTGRRHARTLVAELRDLLTAHHVAARDCELVAVSIGPGSFTGLRVGVVCAKSFAWAAGCAVVGVDTLAAVAAGVPAGVQDVHVIADAQRGDVFAARYLRQPDRNWTRHGDVEMTAFARWQESLPANAVVSGPGLERFGQEWNVPATRLPKEHWHPRAAIVAALGAEVYQQRGTDDLWTLEPLYLRKSAAEEKRDAAE